MYERFSDPARRAMGNAHEEALRMRDDYVGTEHILMALADEPEGIAGSVLQSLSFSVDDVRAQVARLVEVGPGLIRLRTSWWMFWRRNRLPETPRTMRVVEAAMEEVRAAGAGYVGTEHLLLGASQVDGGIAAHVLRELGCDSKSLAALIAERHQAGIREATS